MICPEFVCQVLEGVNGDVEVTLERGPVVRVSWIGLEALRSRLGLAADAASLAVRIEPVSILDVEPAVVALLRGGRVPTGEVRLEAASRALAIQLDAPGRYRVLMTAASWRDVLNERLGALHGRPWLEAGTIDVLAGETNQPFEIQVPDELGR